MKALMIIAMLAVTEGRRLQQVTGLGKMLESSSVSSSHGGRGGKDKANAPDSDTGVTLQVPMDVVMNDLALIEDLVSSNRDRGAFALFTEEAPSSPLLRSPKIANEMDKLASNLNSIVDFSLPKAMEETTLDQDIEKQAQVSAEEVQEHGSPTTVFQDKLAASVAIGSSEPTSTLVSEKVTQVMTDPEFQDTSMQVSKVLASLMQAPETLGDAELLASYVEAVKASSDPDIAEKVSEQVEKILRNKKFTTNVSAIAYEMLDTAVKENLETAANDKFVEELIALAETPNQELLKAMRARGSTPEVMEELKKAMRSRVDKAMEKNSEPLTATQFSLVESRQENVNKPHNAKRLLTALLLLVGQGSAFQVGRFSGRSLIAIVSQRNSQPASGGWSPTFHSAEGKAQHRILMSDLGSEERAAKGAVPYTGTIFQQPKPDVVALTWAEAIRYILPELRSALQSGARDIHKGFRVNVGPLLFLAVWYLFSIPFLTFKRLIRLLSDLSADISRHHSKHTWRSKYAGAHSDVEALA